MNPQVGAVSPQPVTTSPQGAASVTPNATPVAPQLPQAPAIAATPAPVATPNFNTSAQLGNIAAYYNIPRQTAAISGAGQAQGQVAQQQFEANKAQNEIKIQNQQNSLDPSKYQFTKNSDGSVSILNSVGDKVDIGTYAALTGENPVTALTQAGATDQADQKFIAAYNNLQGYVQAKIAATNGDAQAQAQVKQYEVANPGLQNLELGQLQTAFMNQYGQYFGQPQQGAGGGNLAAGVTSTLSSLNNPSATSAYENPTYTNLPGGSSAAAAPYTPSPVASYGSNASSSSSLANELSQLQAQAGQ